MANTAKKKNDASKFDTSSKIVELPIVEYKLADGKVESITIDTTKSTVHLLRFETSETGLSATCAAIIDGCYYHLNLSYRDAYKLLFG